MQTASKVRVSDAQHGVLHQLYKFGPINTVEIAGPPGMDGKRKVKLDTGRLTTATLAKLVTMGLVTVSHGEIFRPTDATGRKGHPRRPVCISITAEGLAQL